MKTKYIGALLILSLSFNFYYLYRKQKEAKHKEDFLSVFEIKAISYTEGFDHLHQAIDPSRQKRFYLIQVWDTLFLDSDNTLPFLFNADSLCGENTNVQGLLISSLSDDAIYKCMSERNLHFRNFVLINHMDDYISGVCNLKGLKDKPRNASLLINEKGDVLFFKSKRNTYLSKDSAFVTLFHSLN